MRARSYARLCALTDSKRRLRESGEHAPTWRNQPHEACGMARGRQARRGCDLLEEASRLHVDTHGGEDDGEVGLAGVARLVGLLLDQARLPADLRRDFVVGKTWRRKAQGSHAAAARVSATQAASLRAHRP